MVWPENKSRVSNIHLGFGWRKKEKRGGEGGCLNFSFSFFYIRKIYTKNTTLSKKSTKQSNTTSKKKKKRKKLITKEKRTNKQIEGITRCEYPSPRIIVEINHLMKQAIGLPKYQHPQTYVYNAPSIYNTSGTTKFKMSDKCFPNQFHQPKRRSSTVLGRTQETPNQTTSSIVMSS